MDVYYRLVGVAAQLSHVSQNVDFQICLEHSAEKLSIKYRNVRRIAPVDYQLFEVFPCRNLFKGTDRGLIDWRGCLPDFTAGIYWNFDSCAQSITRNCYIIGR